mmetsp:Transcript_16449/g.35772  ORF Transcript_16449/g.35772 Transcript_16449/m.35772 type:complete len:275 (-) Transcript_16449:120-944(-)|eukprot:CAMPEP_0178486912 /NCGR_PEP_ID=MMETSP0696-20121128/9049_1 /TAXON_ID=265572 /ORGANISM="Extubocellulus spinifer, Strain CCMP396" /LENGTH=274 /DNA_ID=CAMNT_0020114585 /DNA_START=66 /DNA_END=890 /DNA_ORIENTATION=-
MSATCDNDGCSKVATKKCTGCSTKMFCSRVCQKAAWEEHSYECSPTAPPLSFESLRQSRPQVSSPSELEDLIDEIKRTYYPNAVSKSSETVCKNGVPQGYIVISKIARDNVMLRDFNANELNAHIILILTKKRHKIQKLMVTAIAGEEEANFPGSALLGAELAPNVSLAYHMAFRPRYDATDNTRHKFDLLYGFTGAIYRYWFWMRRHPYDWDGHDMLAELAVLWNSTLSMTPEQLGVDPVFSFPAIRELVRNFKRDVVEEKCGCPGGLRFDYE